MLMVKKDLVENCFCVTVEANEIEIAKSRMLELSDEALKPAWFAKLYYKIVICIEIRVIKGVRRPDQT